VSELDFVAKVSGRGGWRGFNGQFGIVWSRIGGYVIGESSLSFDGRFLWKYRGDVALFAG
jgi:hypothetical protein